MRVSNIPKREMPKTADELEVYLSEKFHRIMMSGDFASYDGFMDDYFRVQDDEDHFPGCAFPCEIRQGEVSTGAAGGPSRKWGSAATGSVTHHRSIGNTSKKLTAPDGRSSIPANITSPETESANEPTDQPQPKATAMQHAMLPPITNRGATLYHNTLDPAAQQDCTASPETKTTNFECPHIMGGYDGGVEVGFDGKWNEKAFEKLTGKLEAARTAAQIKDNDDRYITLKGREFMVQPYGAGKDVNYRYVAENE